MEEKITTWLDEIKARLNESILEYAGEQDLKNKLLLKCVNYQKDISLLMEAIEAKDEVLKKFAITAEWSSGDSEAWPVDSRACGIGCDMGGAGEPTIDGHDYDCPINEARKVLAWEPEKK